MTEAEASAKRCHSLSEQAEECMGVLAAEIASRENPFAESNMLKTAWKLLCLSLVACTVLKVSACEKYDLPGTTLMGTVGVETFYGPPGYGESPETDSTERQAILHLVKPLCTLASDDSPSEQDQMKVTLVPMDNLILREFVGKMVTVRGSLFHAITGHHHTEVLMAIREAPVVLPARRLP